MVYELKLKKKLKDAEFILLWNEDDSATVEFENWNKCEDAIYNKFKTRKDIEFRKFGGETDIDQMSIPANRLTRENLAMAKFKRQMKVTR